MKFLRKCCFCVSLKLGVFIIAIIHIVIDVIAAVALAVYCGKDGIDLANILLIIFFALHIITCVVLIYAVHFQDGFAFNMIPYLAYTLVMAIALLVYFIVDLLAAISWVVLVCYIVHIPVCLYSLWVVFSYYAFQGGSLGLSNK